MLCTGLCARHTPKCHTPTGKIVVRPPSAQLSGGRVVITGGLGSLGAATAAWLTHQGAIHVDLLSRNARVSMPLSLATSAACVTACSLDASMAADVMCATNKAPPITHLLHAAGVLRDGTYRSQTASRMRSAWGPKAAAWSSLQQHSLSMQPCVLQVAFSSVASALGSPGQLNYAAANAQLDTCATAQQASGVAAVSMQWGPFAGSGMAAQDSSTAARVAHIGMHLLTMKQGLAALRRVLTQSQASPILGAFPINWQRYIKNNPAAVPLASVQLSAKTTPTAEFRPTTAAGGLSLAQIHALVCLLHGGIC